MKTMHTVKDDPGEMPSPGMYCSLRNRGETFQCCSLFQKLELRVRQVFNAQMQLHIWVFPVTSTGQSPAAAAEAGEGKG